MQFDLFGGNVPVNTENLCFSMQPKMHCFTVLDAKSQDTGRARLGLMSLGKSLSYLFQCMIVPDNPILGLWTLAPMSSSACGNSSSLLYLV